MKIVSKLMVQPQHIIKSSDSLKKAIRVIMGRQLSVCVVKDSSGNYLGEITDSIVVRAMLMRANGVDVSKIQDLTDLLTVAPTVVRTDSLEAVISKVFKSRSQRVYVIDGRGKLLGLIRPKEVLGYFLARFNMNHLFPGATALSPSGKPIFVPSDKQRADKIKKEDRLAMSKFTEGIKKE